MFYISVCGFVEILNFNFIGCEMTVSTYRRLEASFFFFAGLALGFAVLCICAYQIDFHSVFLSVH